MKLLVIVNSKFNVTISNPSGSFHRNLELYSIPKITEVCPAKYIDVASLNIPENNVLVDSLVLKPAKILLKGEIFLIC